jgi:hypothetical protein
MSKSITIGHPQGEPLQNIWFIGISLAGIQVSASNQNTHHQGTREGRPCNAVAGGCPYRVSLGYMMK